jgi:hypothetical protein
MPRERTILDWSSLNDEGSTRIVRGRDEFSMDDEGSVCFSRRGRVVWTESIEERPPSKPQYNVSRRIESPYWGPARLWTNHDASIVARMINNGLGVRVDAWRGRDGKHIWSRPMRLPPPAPFAEKRVPKWLPAEELMAFFARTPDALLYCVQRTTRCASDGERAIPPFQCRLDVVSLQPRTGSRLWSRRVDGAHVSIVEQESFMGLLVDQSHYRYLNPRTGACRVLRARSGPRAAYPRRIGPRVLLAEHVGRALTATTVDFATGKLQTQHTIACPCRQNIDIYVVDGRALINVDARTYVLLDRAFRPLKTLVVHGWFRNFRTHRGGPLEVITTCRRVLLDRDTGRVLSQRKI